MTTTDTRIGGVQPSADTVPRRQRKTLFRLDSSLARGTTILLGLATFAALLIVWWLATTFGGIDTLFLPSPVTVGQELVGQVTNGQLPADVGISSARILVSFVIAAVMALPAGIMASRIRFIGALSVPFLEFVRYMPLVAFIPLTIIWAGTSEFQKIIVLWIGTFFSLTLMVIDDVARVPREFVEVGRTFGMKERRILGVIVFRAALPGIWDSLRLSLGWCWSWVTFSELVASTSGLGYRITIAQRYSDVGLIFGYIIVLGLLGLVTDQVMRAIHHLLFRYLSQGR